MSKLNRLRSFIGKEFADSFEQELYEYPHGSFEDSMDAFNLVSGTYSKQYSIYYPSANAGWLNSPLYEIPTETYPILWKCEGCGKVYKVDETLECGRCGMSITEKSRFVLLEK